MAIEVVIHPRIHERHPEITDKDVLQAWNNCHRSVQRLNKNPDEYIAIGFDDKGRVIEFIFIWDGDNAVLIYHAFTPPTHKALKELGLR